MDNKVYYIKSNGSVGKKSADSLRNEDRACGVYSSENIAQNLSRLIQVQDVAREQLLLTDVTEDVVDDVLRERFVFSSIFGDGSDFIISNQGLTKDITQLVSFIYGIPINKIQEDSNIQRLIAIYIYRKLLSEEYKKFPLVLKRKWNVFFIDNNIFINNVLTEFLARSVSVFLGKSGARKGIEDSLLLVRLQNLLNYNHIVIGRDEETVLDSLSTFFNCPSLTFMTQNQDMNEAISNYVNESWDQFLFEEYMREQKSYVGVFANIILKNYDVIHCSTCKEFFPSKEMSSLVTENGKLDVCHTCRSMFYGDY